MFALHITKLMKLIRTTISFVTTTVVYFDFAHGVLRLGCKNFFRLVYT